VFYEAVKSEIIAKVSDEIENEVSEWKELKNIDN